MSVPVLCSGIAKTFPGGVAAVAPLDLRIAPRQTTGLVGPSGCGKSTLLRMIAGLEVPSEGTVTIDGLPPAALLAEARLSVAFQDPSLLPWRSVRQNIALALELARRAKSAAEIDDLIRLVGLDGFAETRPPPSPGACASGRPWRGRFPPSPSFCFSMSPSVRWMS